MHETSVLTVNVPVISIYATSGPENKTGLLFSGET